MAQARAVSKLQRTVETVRILYRNDILGMLRELAVADRTPGPRGGALVIPPEMPRKVRRTLEELGPTFVKIGQLLGTRPDLIPKEFVDEFRNLYDRTTPSPFLGIKVVLERELGRPLDDVFSEFEEVPVASASIGQVHFAVLKSGEKVAVKVQHPDIEERVWVDFEIMEPIVRFIENLFAASRVWQPREHLNEVFEMLVKELDYRYEARNQQRVVDNFADDPSVKIPRIYWEYSAKRVLVLERIEGVKLSDFDNPDLLALDGPRLARVITYAMAKQIFEDRLFHADPSPGNLMAMDSGTVAFLDFGAVGKVTRRRSERILHMILGFVRNDVEAVTHSLYDVCNVYGDVDMKQLARDAERIMDYHERERASVADPVVLEMMVEVAKKHSMLLPPDFLLITRALFQFEGLCKKLDPNYELVEVMQPYIVGLVRKRLFTPATAEVALDAAFQTTELVRTLPSRISTIVRKMETSEFRFKVDLASMGEYQQKEERRSFRTAFTVLVGALILGSGLVLAFGALTFLLPFLFVAFLFVLLWAFVMLYLSD